MSAVSTEKWFSRADRTLASLPEALEVAVEVSGAQLAGAAGVRELFNEDTLTTMVFEDGAVVRLTAAIAVGQMLFLKHKQSQKEIVTRVLRQRNFGPGNAYVELEFAEPAPGFWSATLPTAAPAKPAPPVVAAAESPAAGAANESAEYMYELLSNTASAEVPDLAPAPAIAANGSQPGSPMSNDADAPHVGSRVAPQDALRASELDGLRALLSAEAPAARKLKRMPSASPTPPPPCLTNAQTPAKAAAQMSTRPENSVEDSGGDGAQVQLGAHGGSPAETHPEARNDQERVENLLAEEAADAAKAADGKGQPSSVTTVKPPVVQNASRIRLLAAALILVALAGVAYQRGYRADWLANRFFTASTAGAATVSPAKASQAPKGTSAANTASAATNAPLADASLRPQDPSEPARDDASQGRKPPRSSSVDSDPRGAERLANVSSAALASDSTGAADEPPTLVKSVNAVPPPEAVQNFVTGDVKFDALVDATGQVSSAFVVSGPSALRAAALEALKHYQYKPATRNGQPVAGHVTVIVKFWYEP